MAKTETAESTAAKLQEKLGEAIEAAGEVLSINPEFLSKAEFVKKTRAQLGEHLAAGADKCKNCGHEVVGMLKTPAYFDTRNGVDMPAVWEIGCVVCPPVYVTSDKGTEVKLDGKKATVARRSYSARGTSIEQARENWNTGNFVEDTKLDLNMPEKERARVDRRLSE